MLRDKDYVRTANGMLFNVTGYEHPRDAVFASLKYLDGEKWTRGYAAACDYLKDSPFVDSASGYLQVPTSVVEEIYRPRQRWRELQATKNIGPLHREALELGQQIGDVLQIPLNDFGITDSLLWGDGHVLSDIDLIVVGLDNARQILGNAHLLYATVDFERPDPNVMTAPYGMEIAAWPWLLSRKQHMGVFRQRLFSLRVVLADHELPVNTLVESNQDGVEQAIEFEVADASRSLLFPTIYVDPHGNELCDYSVVYEGVFHEGEVVRCHAQPESLSDGRLRYVASGLCEKVQ